jgi:hypothetical protein
MADYSAIRAHFDDSHTSYYTFYPKSDKPISIVIIHLPIDTPAVDICNGLMDFRRKSILAGDLIIILV